MMSLPLSSDITLLLQQEKPLSEVLNRTAIIRDEAVEMYTLRVES